MNTRKIEVETVTFPEHSLGIDVSTKDIKKLLSKLRALKSTVSACDGGMYHEDRAYSQVHIRTTMTEAQLDHWLWTTQHGADYFGVFARGTQ